MGVGLAVFNHTPLRSFPAGNAHPSKPELERKQSLRFTLVQGNQACLAHFTVPSVARLGIYTLRGGYYVDLRVASKVHLSRDTLMSLGLDLVGENDHNSPRVILSRFQRELLGNGEMRRMDLAEILIVSVKTARLTEAGFLASISPTVQPY